MDSLRRGAENLKQPEYVKKYGGTGFFLPADQWVLLADYVQLLQLRECSCGKKEEIEW